MSETYENGELFVYTNGDRWELGMVKRPGSGDGYFCWYSRGDTAAFTPTSCMHKLSNAGFTHIEQMLDDATIGADTDETDARDLMEAIRDDDGVRYSMDEVMDIMGKDVAATVGNAGYGIQFAEWCEFPPETMVGETVFDGEGNAIGWIVNATVGAGTCKRVYHPNRLARNCTCSNCGYGASDERWAYCPKCQARIKEETE